MSLYVQAVIGRSELEERVAEKLEALRQQGIATDADAYPVAAALLRGRDRDTSADATATPRPPTSATVSASSSKFWCGPV